MWPHYLDSLILDSFDILVFGFLDIFNVLIPRIQGQIFESPTSKILGFSSSLTSEGFFVGKNKYYKYYQ